MSKVSSIFKVTSYKTGKSLEEVVEGYGEKAVKELRSRYPRFTKLVLEGFEFDGGDFKPLRYYK